jgi:hypothetical protein
VLSLFTTSPFFRGEGAGPTKDVCEACVSMLLDHARAHQRVLA